MVQTLNSLGIANFARFELRHGVRQVAVNTAGTEVSRMHSRAANGFVHVKQIFTFAKRIEQQGHGPAIQTMRTHPQQMVEHACDFGEHHTDVLSAQRHLNTHHFLNSQTVGMLIAHHRHIIKPVHIGQ